MTYRSETTTGEVVGGMIGGLMAIGLVLASIAAWVTHVIASIQAGAYILLAVGAILAPVGVIHGIMVWFGMPWG